MKWKEAPESERITEDYIRNCFGAGSVVLRKGGYQKWEDAYIKRINGDEIGHCPYAVKRVGLWWPCMLDPVPGSKFCWRHGGKSKRWHCKR